MRTSLLLLVSTISMAFTANAQCFPDRHNTSWNEGWVSCEARLNPNSEHGEGHWIMYDFGYNYTLGKFNIWNYNAHDWLDIGMREVIVDYSNDGVNWKNIGSYILDQANGKSTYQGQEVGNFLGDTAKYVLITGVDNYGAGCMGLSEVKFEILDNVSEIFAIEANQCFKVGVYPNPHTEQFSFNLSSKCKGEVLYMLFDHTGKLLLEGKAQDNDGQLQRIIPTQNLANGLYHLVVRQGDHVGRFPVVKTRM